MMPWSYIVELAMSNLWRNRRRNVFVVLTIAGCALAIVLFAAFVERVFWGVRESTIHSQTGHLQLTRINFEKQRTIDPLSVLIDNADPIVEKISHVPGVMVVTTRLEFSGLVGIGDRSTVFMGMGVEPDNETLLTSFDKVIEGEDMSTGESAVLGIGLAQAIEAKPGDTALIMTRTFANGINGIDIHISGLTQSDSNEYDQRILKIPMEKAQQLLGTEGISRIVVLLEDTAQTTRAKAQIEQLSKQNNWGLEVTDWQALNPSYGKIVMLYTRIFTFIAIMVVAVVLLSLSNTMLMNFYERFRELGIMRTIGTSRNTLAGIFLIEGTVLGLVGAALGVASAAAIILTITHVFDGLPMPPPPGSDQGYRLKMDLNPWVMLSAMGVSALIGLLTSLNPISRVGKIPVALWMRKV